MTLKHLSGALLAVCVSGHLVAEPVLIQDCEACPPMIVIPAGSYWMGSSLKTLDQPFLEADRVTVEQPRQAVTIEYDFALGATEVTVDQYAAFIAETGYESSECMAYDFEAKLWKGTGSDWSNPGFEQSGNYPAVCLSWMDGQEYASWLSNKTGQVYRLPSEAEWEYAARAGNQALWPWGEEKDQACVHANVADQSGVEAGVASAQAGMFECNDGFVYTSPADFGQASAFGLHGMIGNAGEWQQDCMVRTLEGAPTDGSARAFPDCIERVMRGGSWFNPPMYNRPAFRYGTLETQAFNLVGIRVARDIQANENAQSQGGIHPSGSDPDPKARIKRMAIQVPDLDRAIVFYRDVIGFTIEMQGVIEAGAEPYLHLLFRTDPEKSVRRVLMSTGTEKRGLFLVENTSMTGNGPDELRDFAAVIEVSDIRAAQARSAAAGFETEKLKVSETSEGIRFAEMIINGPGGQGVLVFEYGFALD